MSNLPPVSVIRAALEDATQEAGEVVLEAARKNAPVLSGELRESGEVKVSGTTATITFSTPYARRQHEDMRAQHPGGGGAKYLEKALNSETDAVRDAVAQRIRDALGG